MADLSQILFPIGSLFIGLGFAAHLGHALMLANGRRSLPVLVPGARQQPAWAGVVTGSFAARRSAEASGTPSLAASPTPLGKAAVWLTFIGFAALAASLTLRGILVGRVPW